MIKVLVVDDDFMVAQIHRGFVERTPGFTVVDVAYNGADALQSAHDLRPDLVLLDIYLPDMSGLDVLERLHKETAALYVLVITAAREVDTVRQALRGGVVNYLLKPFEYEALRGKLEHFAETHRTLAEADTAEQPALDEIFPPGTTSAKPLPKGLSPETAERVKQVLRDAGGDLSAAECASLTGLSRSAARRYLEYFVTIGKARVGLRYGSTGRPERRYVWRSGTG